jgi:hypothetical protein
MFNRFPLLAATFLLLTPPGLAQTPASPAAGATAAPAKPAQPAAKPAPKKKTAKPPAKPATKTVTETAPPQGSAAGRQAAPLPPGAASTPIDTTAVALAREKEELQQLRGTTLNLIRLLVEQGVLSQEKAEQIVREAERGAIAPTVPVPAATVAAAAAAPAAEPAAGGEPPRRRGGRPPAEPEAEAAEAKAGDNNVVRVTYVPEVVKNEIRDQVREEVIAQAKAERWAEPSSLPEWLDRITWEGDLRLRYQQDMYGDRNPTSTVYSTLANLDPPINTTQDDARFRYRARLGMLARITETWSTGFRLTSGNTTDPVSTNQTLGNYSNRGLVTLDRAYLRWDPSERWTVSGGRMPNPYFHTDLLWDEDLTFEGAYGSFRPRLNDSLRAFVTVGGYLVQHQSPTATTPDPKTKTLVGIQAGGDWDWSSQGKLRLGLAWYDYDNIHGIRNPTLNSQIYDWTAPAFRQKGNTTFNIDNDGNPATNKFALAPKFSIVNLTGSVDLSYFEPFNIRLIGDYAKNIGYDREEIRQRTGLDVPAKTNAWRAGVLLGKPEVRAWKDWHVFVDYRYIQRDAVLDAFTDSDFNLGGTNTKGYTIGGQLGLDRNVWLRLRWLSADEIDNPGSVANLQPTLRYSVDVLQFDINARF